MNDANDHRDPVDELATALGHRFRRPELLTEALTHASAATRPVRGGEFSNERLEFLGDRVLALVIAEMLFETFGRETEGALARRLAALTRKEALAEVGAALDLGRYLQMSRSEADTGGRSHPGMVADACEAVIGALYLDGGLDVARAVRRRCWAPLIGADSNPPQDAKTALQEWAQAARPAAAGLSRAGDPGAGPQPGLRHRGARRGRRARHWPRPLEARGGAGGGRHPAQGRAEHRPMTEPETPPLADQHCGFVAIVGAPNAGKSTLLNRLVGSKVSIVSPKVQTTRNRVLGVVIDGAAQIVFIDTPGIFAPRRRLDRAMVKAAWRGVTEADLTLLLVGCAAPGDGRGHPPHHRRPQGPGPQGAAGAQQDRPRSSARSCWSWRRCMTPRASSATSS